MGTINYYQRVSAPQPQWYPDDQQWSLPSGGQAQPAYDPGVASRSVPPVSGQPVSGPVGYDPSGYQQGYPAGPAGYPVHQGELIPANAAMPVLVQIGDIQVTAATVRTPMGEVPLRGSNWMAQDQWVTSQRTPGWAIACAILGFFCLTVFSLLFLLAKQTVCSGMVNIIVTSGGFQYQTRVPVNSQVQVHHIHQQVNYVRALASR